jgi:hypothetical protein
VGERQDTSEGLLSRLRNVLPGRDESPLQPVRISDDNVIRVQQGEEIQREFTASGGALPYTWMVEGLPTGLRQEQTGDGSHLLVQGSSEPLGPGQHGFHISAMDSQGEQSLRLHVLLDISAQADELSDDAPPVAESVTEPTLEDLQVQIEELREKIRQSDEWHAGIHGQLGDRLSTVETSSSNPLSEVNHLASLVENQRLKMITEQISLWVDFLGIEIPDELNAYGSFNEHPADRQWEYLRRQIRYEYHHRSLLERVERALERLDDLERRFTPAPTLTGIHTPVGDTVDATIREIAGLTDTNASNWSVEGSGFRYQGKIVTRVIPGGMTMSIKGEEYRAGQKVRFSDALLYKI